MNTKIPAKYKVITWRIDEELPSKELVIVSEEGTKKIVPAKHSLEVQGMIFSKCFKCVNEYIKTL